MSRILITGGTGFVGSEIRNKLKGRALRLVVRDSSSLAATNQVEVVTGDVLEPESLKRTFDGCDTVIHLVAIIEESKGNTFDQVIGHGTENVVDAVQAAGVKRIIHMSALGAQANPKYPYLNAKWRAEEAVRNSGLAWTIFRPSVIFGPADGFINVLAKLVRTAPVIPVLGSGMNTFHPVSIGDVGDSFVRAVDDPATVGQVYELGGGEIYSYEQLLDLIAAELGKQKRKVHVPIGVMKTVVALSAPLPKSMRPPVTREQLNMLTLNNVTEQSATGHLIGHEPLSLRDGIGYISGRADGTREI